MKFVTSYYAKISEIKKHYPEYIMVSISGDIPNYIKDIVDLWDKRFAPNWSLFKEYKNSPEGPKREIQYVKRFKNEIMSKRDINSILKEWSDKFGKDKTFVIMCYEKPQDFCHRHIVAEAIENKYNIKIPELFEENSERINYKIKNNHVQEWI